MARTVKDAAHMLSAMSGKSPWDKRTDDIPFETIPDYATACRSTDLTGMRIGVPRSSFTEVDPPVLAALERAIEILTDAGATVVNNTNYKCMEEWKRMDKAEYWSICEADFKPAIELCCQNLIKNPNNIRTLDDIIEFTKKCPEEEYPARDIERWINVKRAIALPAEELQRRREKSLRCSKEDGIAGALEQWDLDLLIAPSVFTASTTFAARAGLPVISVPLGFYPNDAPVVYNERGDLIVTGPNIP